MDTINNNISKEKLLQNVKSKLIFNKIFDYLNENIKLKILKVNKRIQHKLNIGLIDYEKYFSRIEIEIIPTSIDDNFINFINISDEENESDYHIYFDDDSTEIKRTYLTEGDNIKKIKIILNYEFKSLKGLFSDCKNNKKIYFKKFNRNNFKDMSSMFFRCSALNYIDLSNFNTENVTNMSYMFYDCRSLRNLDLSKFNTQNITNFRSMFNGCALLEYLNLSNFNTKNVTDMSEMFYNCYEIENVDLSNFNTENVTDLSRMFNNCYMLKNVNLSSFNTQKVTDMASMFDYCHQLENIDLSNFNTQNVTNMQYFLDINESLNIKNVITNDEKILKLIKK